MWWATDRFKHQTWWYKRQTFIFGSLMKTKLWGGEIDTKYFISSVMTNTKIPNMK